MILRAPTLAVLLGQGTGGGALALVPADRVLAAANGWLGPLPPEGASAIVHRDITHAGEMAQEQGVRATELWRAGIVDRVVPERPDAAEEPNEFCERLGRVLGEEIAGLLGRAGIGTEPAYWLTLHAAILAHPRRPTSPFGVLPHRRP